MKKNLKNKTLRTLDALTHQGLIKENDLPQLEKVVETFSLAITPTMQALINKNNPHDPLAKQFIPDVRELTHTAEELSDPIGDDVHQKVKGIIHRYPDRCLFLPVSVCPIYCRFCFRREKIGGVDGALSPQELDVAFEYIESHSEIWEVIITGGDPFILKPKSLQKIIDRLNQITHIAVIRIHTRVPVVDPLRINLDMIHALRSEKAVYVLLHANHVQEFTAEAIHACAQLINAGIPMLGHTTLLKGVNDSVEVLTELMRFLVKNRIKPYYLHHADLAKGTKHFRTTLAESQALMKQLRGRLSGLCQPTLILDIPGGYGKVPVGHQYVHWDGDQYKIEDYQGEFHTYLC